MKTKSFLFVFLQFSFILIILFTGPVIPSGVVPLLLFVAGIILVFWSVIAMRIIRISVFPDPLPGSELIKGGPYRFIRHPMYLSVILICTALLIQYFTYPRLFVVVCLVSTLLVKMNYEEKLLTNSYLEYREYSKKTKKLIPFFY